jgi:hypothetical protein
MGLCHGVPELWRRVVGYQRFEEPCCLYLQGESCYPVWLILRLFNDTVSIIHRRMRWERDEDRWVETNLEACVGSVNHVGAKYSPRVTGENHEKLQLLFGHCPIRVVSTHQNNDRNSRRSDGGGGHELWVLRQVVLTKDFCDFPQPPKVKDGMVQLNIPGLLPSEFFKVHSKSS